MAGGYRLPRTVYRLTFDGVLEGMEVRIRSLTVGEMLGMRTFEQVRPGPMRSEADRKAWREAIDLLADNIVDWNLEDEDGQPRPATADELCALEPDHVFSIVVGWLSAMAGVSGPLERTSTDGDPSLEGSIPME